MLAEMKNLEENMLKKLCENVVEKFKRQFVILLEIQKIFFR